LLTGYASVICDGTSAASPLLPIGFCRRREVRRRQKPCGLSCGTISGPRSDVDDAYDHAQSAAHGCSKHAFSLAPNSSRSANGRDYAISPTSWLQLSPARRLPDYTMGSGSRGRLRLLASAGCSLLSRQTRANCNRTGWWGARAGISRALRAVPTLLPLRPRHVSSLSPSDAERCKTDPFSRSRTSGSGPFIRHELTARPQGVLRQERRLCRAAMPRPWSSGGKVVKGRRLEWAHCRNTPTASAALGNGGCDCGETAPTHLGRCSPCHSDSRRKPTRSAARRCCVSTTIHPPFDIEDAPSVLASPTRQRSGARWPATRQIGTLPSFFTAARPWQQCR